MSCACIPASYKWFGASRRHVWADNTRALYLKLVDEEGTGDAELLFHFLVLKVGLGSLGCHIELKGSTRARRRGKEDEGGGGGRTTLSQRRDMRRIASISVFRWARRVPYFRYRFRSARYPNGNYKNEYVCSTEATRR